MEISNTLACIRLSSRCPEGSNDRALTFICTFFEIYLQFVTRLKFSDKKYNVSKCRFFFFSKYNMHRLDYSFETPEHILYRTKDTNRIEFNFLNESAWATLFIISLLASSFIYSIAYFSSYYKTTRLAYCFKSQRRCHLLW